MNQLLATHKYHWKWWHRALRLPTIIMNGALLTFAVYAFIIVTGFILRNITLAALLLVIPIPLLIFIIYSQIILLILNIGYLVATFVTISPDGLEIRIWPVCRVMLRWQGIETALITHRWGRDVHMLSLENAEAIPESSFTFWFWSVAKPFKRFLTAMPRQPFSLDMVQGYPHGRFAEHLRQAAPKLFPSTS